MSFSEKFFTTLPTLQSLNQQPRNFLNAVKWTQRSSGQWIGERTGTVLIPGIPFSSGETTPGISLPKHYPSPAGDTSSLFTLRESWTNSNEGFTIAFRQVSGRRLREHSNAKLYKKQVWCKGAEWDIEIFYCQFNPLTPMFKSIFSQPFQEKCIKWGIEY